MNPADLTTDFLILRRIPYSETSLVVSGISPEEGQLTFLIRGARKIGKRSSSNIDLFRRLRIRYRQGKGDFQSLCDSEILADYAALATRLPLYEAAGKLAKFALQNIQHGISHPNYFTALDTALARFAKIASSSDADFPTCATIALVCTEIAYLDEAGWLPTSDPRSEEQCRQLLDMALGSTPLNLSAETWDALLGWCGQLLEQAGIRPVR